MIIYSLQWRVTTDASNARVVLSSLTSLNACGHDLREPLILVCSANLAGRDFCTKDGLLYCESHQQDATSLICASCSQPISGRCINAMGKRFHLQHFVCTYCLRQLNTGTFKERASKPYCSTCFRQLFG
ncbi:unnamed protein product [Dibothriocephalus latus]|uniref:LIM zinc-binding domain-containing protein n=1 Tax=Dibothriocephalus latus TaxID=60516 RepID=A0A3P6P2Y0_DIBLA|nr:unnamed protein product [Dibothriocephalus latus]